MGMKRILAVLLLLTLAAPAWGQDFEKGYQAYERGDYATAVKWYRKAAEQGNVNAQGILGIMYAAGQGVPQDYAEAVKWYRKAAEQGDAIALFNLGAMYFSGRGVPQDFVQAHMWLNLAAAIGQPKVVIELRDGVAKRMTPAQVAEAQRLARGWMAAFEKRKKK